MIALASEANILWPIIISLSSCIASLLKYRSDKIIHYFKEINNELNEETDEK